MASKSAGIRDRRSETLPIEMVNNKLARALTEDGQRKGAIDHQGAPFHGVHLQSESLRSMFGRTS